MDIFDSLLDENSWRYERKFVVSQLLPSQIEFLVKRHPAVFTERYPCRFINSIYFDSPGMISYMDHVSGVGSKRVKTRIRWYGNLKGLIQSPMLEFKIRAGYVGSKIRFPLANLNVDDTLSTEKIHKVIHESSLSESIKLVVTSLRMVVITRYSRKYFESADQKFRITLDNNMESFQPSQFQCLFLNKSTDHRSTVMEIKYAREWDSESRAITGYFPFNVSKYSKFLTGIEKTCTWA